MKKAFPNLSQSADTRRSSDRSGSYRCQFGTVLSVRRGSVFAGTSTRSSIIARKFGTATAFS
ncbi:MAG: hypothetical protein AAFU41_20335, partial [Pseudomonadota bacterium]